jgi:alpha-L-fucosidase
MTPHRSRCSSEASSRLWALILTTVLVSPLASRASDANERARAHFQDQKFGLFVHWGVYSLIGKSERVMEEDKLPIREYEKLPPRFNPAGFDADIWAKAAKAAGMNYVVVTAKDHDGFCMFDSALTRFDIVDATPYAKDPVKALAEACRKHKLSLWFSYSLLDWHHPDYGNDGKTGRHAGREGNGEWSKYVAYYQGQIRELCTRYGEIGGVRFEGLEDKPDADWDLAGTYRLIHTLQPHALVANHHHRAPATGEDVQVFERALPSQQTTRLGFVGEVCESMNRHWGFHARDQDFKSASAVLRLLANAAGRDANLLLNVAPNADGVLPPEAVERLAEVGRWLNAHGSALFGTRAGPIAPQPWGVSTRREPGVVFLHILKPDVTIRVPVAVGAYGATLLSGSTPVSLPVRQEGNHVLIEFPENDRDPADTVIGLNPIVFDVQRIKERR